MHDDKTLKLEEKNIYGRTVYYPACSMSKLLCSVAQTKQMTDHIIREAKKSGFRIYVGAVAGKEI